MVYDSVARGDAKKMDVLVVADNLPEDRYDRFKLFEVAEKEVEHLLKKLRKTAKLTLDEGISYCIMPRIS